MSSSAPTPQRQLSKYGEGITDGLRSYMRVRELYRAVPPAAEDPDAVAVIIGNRSYDRLPRSVTSYNDADAVYAFLTEHFGYRPDNIIDLRDAKKAELERVFGAEPGFEGDLARLVEGEPDAKILIYYSGHGAAGEADAETYLLPVDTELHREAFGGYRLSTLYANLAALKAKSVLVLLEMEFGRDHGASVLPPNLPETIGTALPQAPVPALTVLLATDRGQRSLPDVTYDIGLFTRYVIEALAGGADRPPVGNGDGALDSAEIYVFTAAFVDLAARKTFGVLQRPVYSGAGHQCADQRRTRALRLQLREIGGARHLFFPLRRATLRNLGRAKKLYKAARISYGTTGSGRFRSKGSDLYRQSRVGVDMGWTFSLLPRSFCVIAARSGRSSH